MGKAQRDRAYRFIHREEIKQRRHERKAALPFVTYSFFDDDLGVCMYVGSGRSIRPGQHQWEAHWWTPELRLEVIVQPSQAHARREEYDLIIKHLPLHNKDGMLGLR